MLPGSPGAGAKVKKSVCGVRRKRCPRNRSTKPFPLARGWQESKKLTRNGALAYATESMRLTTRLMQLASWLLLHRAVKEGEMSLAQANKEKAKVKLATVEHSDEQNLKLVPERLRGLVQRSKALQSAVRRLDTTIHASPARADRSNPVARQLGLLRAAFEHE